MVPNFQHRTLAQKICFGAGRSGEYLAAEVARFGARRILLILTSSAVHAAASMTRGLSGGRPDRGGGSACTGS